MGSADTRYSPIFDLPHLMEQREEVITCPVELAGVIQIPTEVGSNVKLFNSNGDEVLDEQPTLLTANTAQVVIPSATLDAEQFSKVWWAEWRLLMPDGVVHMFRNNAALVRARMYPTINTTQLFKRMKSFDPAQADNITRMTVADFQDKLDEVDIEIQLRMFDDDLRPERVFSPSSLRKAWMSLWISLIFEELSSRRNEYEEAAEKWRQRYERAYNGLTLVYDTHDDGQPDRQRRRSTGSSVWLTDRS